MDWYLRMRYLRIGLDVHLSDLLGATMEGGAGSGILVSSVKQTFDTEKYFWLNPEV